MLLGAGFDWLAWLAFSTGLVDGYEDVFSLDEDGVGFDGKHRREGSHGACLEVKAAAMAWAFDFAVDKFAVGQRPAVVCAKVLRSK
jgi:hypothetical protein